ncbi:MAG: hypothetical protein Q7T13_07450 [Polaromonas sp.]|nr:hypothetical protein [Polaromonas sp.]
MFARERSARGHMKSPSIAQRGEGGVGDALPDSRHARSGPQRDDLLANTPRRVPEGTRKGFGEESARFGPNPIGGVVLRAIRVVTKPGKAFSLALGFAPNGSSRKNPAALGASQATHP